MSLKNSQVEDQKDAHAAKKDLRYSKFHEYEKDIEENHKLDSNDDFERINMVSNQIR